VSFSSGEAKDLLLQLFVDDKKVDQRIFSVVGKGSWQQELHVTVDQAGSHAGLVRLQGDGLLGNSDHHFTIEVEQRLKVYLVDGDPKTSISQSETFFLARALHPQGALNPSSIDPEVVSVEELGRIGFEKARAIFLCNLPKLSEDLKAKLMEFVQKGGGIIFFLGDRVRVEETNRLLFDGKSPLLPVRLREAKRTSGKGDRIGRVDTGHPVLKIFGTADLASSRFHSHLLVDPPFGGGKTLLNLEGGDPLLLERKLGAGRVLVFTSTADRDWNDFSIKPSYVPFVQGLAHYLAGSMEESIVPATAIGDRKEFKVAKRYVGSLGRILTPDKKERDIVFKPTDDLALATFTDHSLPGHYRLLLSGESISYSVNPPLAELDAQPISEALIRERFRPAKIELFHIGPGRLRGEMEKRDLSSILLLSFTAILVLEGIVSHRG
jgi:hypothetical protein